MHEPATDTHLYLIALLYLNVNALLTKLVDALGLSQEQHFEIVAFRVLVDVIRKLKVYFVSLVPDGDRLRSFHQFLHLLHELVYFVLRLQPFFMGIFQIFIVNL